MIFEKLHTEYAHFFKHFRPRYENVFFMSLDAEWYEYGGRNVVLSYQVATVSMYASNNVIKYMAPGERMTLVDCIQYGLKSVTTEESFNNLRDGNTLVVLVSHNFVAEYSVLADRDEEYLTKCLTVIRKSPITNGNTIKIVVDKTVPVDVQIFDTMLLAPASHRSLKKLSGLLGSQENEKETVSQFNIEHMNLYLRDHPEEFEKYALQDSKVTLMLFFILQDCLYKLVGDPKKFKLYVTLASAAVKGFIFKNDWFKKYQKTLKSAAFAKPYQLIKRCYHGGRNEGYIVGRIKNKIFLDIDFSGCYPTAMALCPKIDLDAPIDHITLEYVIDDKVVARLKSDNVPYDLICKVKEALGVSRQEFDNVLSAIPNKKLAWKIRSAANVVDNRLINKWRKQWLVAKENGDDALEKFLIPGFARVRFKFPSDTQFPCLPIRQEKFGLLYVLEGETCATASEIMLAMDAGAHIEALTSLELSIVRNGDGVPIRFVMEHLKELAKLRIEYKKCKSDPVSQIMEKLVKEFMNSFYGKFAQAINFCKMYRVSTGEMEILMPSAISEPCTAALVTSLGRSSLSATLIAIERFNKKRNSDDQITVVSATTDGLLIGIPAPENFSVMDDYYEMIEGVPQMKKGVDAKLPDILKRFGYHELLAELDEFLPIRQMRNSRLELTENPEILEIKHTADEVISVKTRGQIGLLKSGHASIIARFGHKPPLSEIIKDSEEYKRIMDAGGVIKDTADAEWLLDHIERIENGHDVIDSYDFITLTNLRDIVESDGELDLMKKISPHKINTDFDWKRKLVTEEKCEK